MDMHIREGPVKDTLAMQDFVNSNFTSFQMPESNLENGFYKGSNLGRLGGYRELNLCAVLYPRHWKILS